jgi:hypothetical protein
MAKATKQLPQRIATVDQALAALGGDDRVAKWLRVDPHMIEEMRRHGYVHRDWCLHFLLSLQARGYDPQPSLFGLKSWRSIKMRGHGAAR